METKKFKLINRTTKEEFICEKVTIDGYDYYVSDERVYGGTFQSLPEKDTIRGKVKCDCYVLDKKDGKIYPTNFEGEYVILDRHLLVIATNNPIIDVPKVIDEVELASQHIKLGFGMDVEYWFFKKGYNKSQELYPFSKEDMIEFAKFAKSYKSSRKVGVAFEMWKENKVKTIYYE